MERTDFEQWKAKEVARLLALVETERRYYQEMAAAVPVPLVILSAERQVVWANRAFRREFGLRAEELRRRAIDQLLPIEGLTGWIEAAHRQTGESSYSARLNDRSFRVAAIPMRNWDDESEVETLLMLDPAASETGPTGTVEPVPEPVPAPPERAAPPEPAPTPEPAPEPAATQPEPSRIPSAIASALPAILWQADAETLEFRAVDGMAEELLGYPRSHWLNREEFFEERMYPDDRAATMALYRDALSQEGRATAEFRCVSASGQVVWCRETVRATAPGGAAPSLTGVLTVIDRRKQLQRQLLLGNRMEGLQEFSARLAHDLNNPLMIATGYGEELMNALEEGVPARDDLAEMLAANRRIAALASQLTDLARRHANAPTRLNVAGLMVAWEARLAHAVGDQVTLELESTDEPVWAAADQEQLGEVLEALVSGDRDGAEERTRVRIAWDVDTIEERTSPPALSPGRYARITIRDDGRGLEEHRQRAVFDPVLERDGESGGGSALARAYYLVRQWGGDIAFSSEPYRGSTLAVYLPYAEPEPGLTRSVHPVVQAPISEEGEPARETVLVVDDEAGIRGLMRKILQRERYQVLEAGNGDEALAAATAHGGPIDLLLTDVVLPGMMGPELARTLAGLYPDIRILYISGYTPDENVAAGDYPPGARFLAKPFTLGALLGKVRETLDG